MRTVGRSPGAKSHGKHAVAVPGKKGKAVHEHGQSHGHEAIHDKHARKGKGKYQEAPTVKGKGGADI